MNQIIFFVSQNQTTVFTQFPDEDGLPFPLYLPLHWKLFISSLLLISLVVGLQLRLIIFSFLRSPESNLGPINYLIWVDEANGVINAVVIVVRIAMIHSTHPLNAVFGHKFGQTVGLLSCIYNSGCCFWGFYISFYRVMYITNQNWLIKTVGAKRLLKILVCFGTAQVIILSFFYNEFDAKGSIIKSSDHTSTTDIDIFSSYEVWYILLVKT